MLDTYVCCISHACYTGNNSDYNTIIFLSVYHRANDNELSIIVITFLSLCATEKCVFVGVSHSKW